MVKVVKDWLYYAAMAVTGCRAVVAQAFYERLPFALQKASFYTMKGRLSRRKRLPFAKAGVICCKSNG